MVESRGCYGCWYIYRANECPSSSSPSATLCPLNHETHSTFDLLFPHPYLIRYSGCVYNYTLLCLSGPSPLHCTALSRFYRFVAGRMLSTESGVNGEVGFEKTLTRALLQSRQDERIEGDPAAMQRRERKKLRIASYISVGRGYIARLRLRPYCLLFPGFLCLGPWLSASMGQP